MSESGVMTVGALEAMLEEGRHAELVRALAAAEDDPALPRLELLRLRGRLALEGEGPVADLAAAADALAQASHPTAPFMTAQAARLLHRAGARGRARELLDRARRAWPDDEAVRLVEDQLAAGLLDGASRAEWRAWRAIAEARWDEARAALRAIVEGDGAPAAGACPARTPAGRVDALCALADLARAEGRFADAGAALAEAAAAEGRGDGALVLRLTAALARWAAGEDDAAAAVSELEALRESTERALRERAEGESPAGHGFVHAMCADVLMSLDRATTPAAEASDAAPERRSASERLRAVRPSAGSGRQPRTSAAPRTELAPSAAARRAARPAWIPARPVSRPCRARHRDPGRGVVAHLCEVHGVPLDDAEPGPQLPSMPHVRQALERAGLATRRVVVDDALLRSALSAGVHVVLEEELSIGTGFVLVVGFEPVGGLLLVLSPERAGPYLTSLEMQWRRCALTGRSGLLVTGAGVDTAALGSSSERITKKLAALDACHIDASGRVPPRARIHDLAHQALDVADDVPLTWLRLGESILARMQAGELSPFEDGVRMVRLHSDTRDRFPDAEWPLTLHAQLLELQGRREEAGIAWSDAALRDPFDARNHVGMARAAFHLDDLAAARRHARRALALRSGDAEAHALLAQVRLEDRRGGGAALDEAALFAELAVDMAPKDARAQLALASVHERRGRFDAAEALLAELAERDARDLDVRLRLLRRSQHGGDWAAVAERSRALCATAPEAVETWEHAADAALALGEGAAAVDLALTGIQRCGPHPLLVSRAVRAAACGFPPEEVMGVVHAVLGLSAGQIRVLPELVDALRDAGLDEAAEDVARQALELTGGRPQQAWQLIRLLLSRRGDLEPGRPEAAARLEALVTQLKDAPLPRILLGWLVLAEAPERTLELLDGAALGGVPALGWQLTARALAATGHAEQARRVRERLREVYPAGALEPASFLRSSGLGEAALELLDGALAAFPDDVPCRVERARALWSLQRRREALDELLRAEALDPARTPRGALLDAAHAVADWEVVRRVAAAHVEEGLADSRPATSYDVWPARARFAGASLALGDPAPREALLARAGRHPIALATLCEIERRIDAPEGDERAAWLEDLAPGALRLVEAGLR